MAENTKATETVAENTTGESAEAEETTDETENTSKFTFLRKAVEFEGKKVEKIDFSGLEDLTGKDLREIDKIYRRTNGGSTISKELDTAYLRLIASRATGYPLEFFDVLSAKDATLVEVVVRNFLLL